MVVIILQLISTESWQVYGKTNGRTVKALITLIGAVVNQFKGNLSPTINVSKLAGEKHLLMVRTRTLERVNR